jgi:addiction module HigA family antidote
LQRELDAGGLSANGLALDLGVPSGRITDILNGRRGITADTAVRLGRYFCNRPQFWLDLQAQYEIAVVERDRGDEIARRVHPPTRRERPANRYLLGSRRATEGGYTVAGWALLGLVTDAKTLQEAHAIALPSCSRTKSSSASLIAGMTV